jgi:predicted DNA-binding transcriptional regulator AlpA
MAIPQELDILTRKEAAGLLRISDRSLMRLCEDGRGPRRLKLSARRIGFLREDVLDWVTNRRNQTPAMET